MSLSNGSPFFHCSRRFLICAILFFLMSLNLSYFLKNSLSLAVLMRGNNTSSLFFHSAPIRFSEFMISDSIVLIKF